MRAGKSTRRGVGGSREGERIWKCTRSFRPRRVGLALLSRERAFLLFRVEKLLRSLRAHSLLF